MPSSPATSQAGGERPRVRVRALSSTALTEGSTAHLAGLAVIGAAPPAAQMQPAPNAEQDRHENGRFRGKKAKAEDDEDDEGDEDGDDESDEDEMSGSEGKRVKGARRRERARCRAILTSAAAQANPIAAANLAFNTRMGRGAAIAMLQTMPPQRTLSGDMAQVKNPNLGPSGEEPRQSDTKAIAESWDRAMAQVPGGTRRR